MPPNVLGPYTILDRLGAGGMGEVYRARDARLDRTVALKLLPTGATADDEQLQRFQREARAASALNHPHIVSIFDAGEIEGTHYIAMELVDGVPLSGWLARERPSVERILDVFIQIADALSAAHDAGIAHRDLKPANVLVNAQGYVKVVDFGLAKMMPFAGSTDTPTLATRTGIVLGTVAYMSPEQASGIGLDARTDVFSLGVMLFEATVGRHPFQRSSAIDTLHAIAHEPPALPRSVRPELQWVIGKSIAKDRAERYQTMREFGADLRRLRRTLADTTTAMTVTGAVPHPRSRVAVPWLIATVAIALGILAAAIAWREAARGRPRPPRIVRMTPLTTDPGFEGEPTFSPDGKLVAYVSDRAGNFDIYLKRIDGGPDVQLTTDPSDDVQPAFSPDGSEIAFVSGRAFPGGIIYPSPAAPLTGGDVWVMPALGGEPRRVATGNHPSWLPDRSAIVFVSGRWFERRLMRVSPSGGEAQQIQLKPVDTEQFTDITRPIVSPNGRWVAFVSDQTIFVVPISGGTPERIAAGRSPAWLPDSAGLVFTSIDSALEGNLMRIGVDADGRPSDQPEMLTAGPQHTAEPTVATDGVHIAFAAETVRSNVEALAFEAEEGRAVPGAQPRPLTTGNDVIFFLNLSPDNRTLTYAARQRIWKMELGKRAVPLTSGTPPDSYPRWSPAGHTIAFARGSSAFRALSEASLWLMNDDGSNPRQLAAKTQNGFFSWSADRKGIIYASLGDRQFHRIDIADGRTRTLTSEKGLLAIAIESADGAWLIMQGSNPTTGDIDLRALPEHGTGQSRIIVSTPGDDVHPMLSPSGKWLFWTIDHRNIYRIPGPAQNWRPAAPEKVTLFNESGLFLEDPQLSLDGRLLLYSRRERTADLWLMELARDENK